MPTKESRISYQVTTNTDTLDQLIARFGDQLESLTAIDKLDLIGVLAFWQSCDTEAQQSDQPKITLGDYLGINYELQIATSRDLDEALEILADCSDGDAMTLLVTLPCQLRDGVFAE